MYCRKCGKEMGGQEKFCPHCGEKNVEMKHKGNHKRKIILTCFLTASVLCIGIAGVFFYIAKTPERFWSEIIEGDAQKAIDIYENSKMDVDTDEELYNLVSDGIQNICEQYYNEEISMGEAREILQKIEMLESKRLQGKIEIEKEKIGKIEDSRKSYHAGTSYLEEQRYLEAINKLEKVIEDDSYYKEATEKIAEAKSLFMKEANNEINQYKEKFEFEKAIETVTEVIESFPEQEWLSLKEQLEYEKELYEISDFLDKKNYDEMKKIWNSSRTAELVDKMEEDKLILKLDNSMGIGLYKVINLGDVEEHVFYYGEYDGEKRAGEGIWFGKDTVEDIWFYYEGEWKEDYPNGKGVYHWEFDNYVRDNIGQFVNGVAEGEMEMAWTQDGRDYFARFSTDNGEPNEITDQDLLSLFQKWEGHYIYAVSEEEPRRCWYTTKGWKLAVRGATPVAY